MGCSNARLLVQAPMASEPGAGQNNSLPSTSPANVSTDTNPTTTRMHLTGVDLVVERNGSYTLLLTPKTHKQLMPYVLRKKRFRILVDKPRSDPTLLSNEPNLNEQIMENNKELKNNTKKDKKSKQNLMESTLESIQQVASDELNKVKTRFIGGRSIDRGNPEDEDENIQSDDEGMIEEIVTTVEEDKDLECKIKKKIETKKTIAQDPETHNTITKVVKTEVTEITRTITINDHHDLERAKRELGIDDVNRLLSSSWTDQTRSTEIREKRYEPINEIVTSKDFPSNSPIKKLHLEEKPILAESTTVGRGPVIETITSSSSVSQQKPIEVKKKKKKSKLCSCTRAADDEQHDKEKIVITPTEQKKEVSPVNTSTPLVKSTIDTQIQGQQLVSSDIKQLITDKKVLLIEYIHSKIFFPSKFFPSTEQDTKARKISSRILDLLRYDRCSSWTQMQDQLKEEYANYITTNSSIQSMVNTYENLFISKQSNLLNTFSTIHNENDIKNIHENNEYITIAQTNFHERNDQPNIEVIQQESLDSREDAVEPLQDEQIEKVINDDDQPVKELKPTDDIQQEILPIYNEEYLIKMLADISQHKPITLAEAIAYEYIDIEDPKLGLSSETIQRIKNLFHPLSDESILNLIRVKRSGEYLTDINLAETNPFEKLNLTEPYVYQLQQSFEPTLDFSEKQFRSLTETILNNKEQYDQLQFDISRSSLPVYDVKDLSINDVSQSDSGYSMTTATHESLASKIKIEFEPIHHDVSIPLKHEDLYEDEKIDLDKATKEQLDKYQLNPELIQIIKMDFHGSDKTIGQAILSRELRLDSADPSDISYLKSLGIHKEQIKILTTFFFPKHSRIIAYSPEPGRFVEAQTTYNPDYPGYKTDTTIIQIQEKQLSSDHLAMQRNIHDDRTSPVLSQRIIESETIVSSPSAPSQEIVPEMVQKDKTSPPPPPPTVHLKKRKSSGHSSFLSCFRSKKSKAGTEQQGQPIVQSTTVISPSNIPQKNAKSVEERPIIDYSILPDGKRIYIDVFRDRPGLDMSYKPNDFENRYVLPTTKPPSEYERPITPEIEPIAVISEIIEETSVPIQSERIENELITQSSIVESEIIDHEAEVHLIPSEPEIVEVHPVPHEPVDIEHKTQVHLVPRPATIEPVDVQAEIVEHKTQVHLIPRPATIEPVDVQAEIVEHKAEVHLVPRPATIEPVDVQPEKIPIVIQSKKTEQITVTKKPTIDLHGAAVNLPEIELELVKPGPLPTIHITKEKKPIKIKKSTGGLCASCFGAKAAEKKKKNIVSEPIEQKKSIEEEHKEDLSPIIESPSLPSTRNDEPILPKVNIDIFKERNFEKTPETFPKPEDRLYATVEKPITPIQSPTTIDTSIFSRVNIDTFKERTLQKGSQNLPRSEEHLGVTNETVTTVSTTKSIESPTSDSPLYSKVNIDVFKERTFEKSSENLPKSEELLDATNEITTPPAEEPHYELSTNELVSSSPKILTPDDSSFHGKVNIDIFRERTLQKSSESLPKSEERLDTSNEIITPSSFEEPHYQLPTNEPVSPPPTNDSSVYSKVNIDIFRERTLQKSSENLPKSEEPLTASNEILIPPSSSEEPHYQLPTSEPVSPPPTNDSSVYSKVNIDIFRERTLQKGSENLPKSKEHPSSDEAHYQLPINEPIPIESTPKDSSIYSKVNIDIFRERNFESPPKQKIHSEAEPHYQSPSVPIENGYSIVGHNTYDIPHTTELQQTTPSVEIINSEIMTSPITDIQKSSGDFVPIGHAEEKSKISPININGSSSKKKKKIKTEKKSGLISTLFRPGQRKSKVPALDLPSIERDLSPNNALRPPHRRDSDPLHIPSTNLPKLDLPLPTYDRPEVNMTTGSTKQSSEFSIPIVNFPSIPNLQLPDVNKQSVDLNSDLMKIPTNEYPVLHYTLNEQENSKLSQIEFQTIETGLALASPVDDMLSIQTDHKTFPIETDYAIQTKTTSYFETEIIIKSTEQLPEFPIHIENQTHPDFAFQLPSPEPILTLPKDSKSLPPSFDDDVPTIPSKIVPAIQSPIKQLIETKKKSSTLTICSCFGNKSNISKEKSHTLAVPKANLPEIDMPIPSSNISSILKTKGSLRAPSNDLPPVDLTLPSTDIIHIQDNKQQSINETEAVVPSNEIKQENEITPIPVVEKQLKTKKRKITSADDIKNIPVESKKSPSFLIKVPIVDIPKLDLSGPPTSDAYRSLSKQESISIPKQIQSRSDSGLEAIISSHINPSSTFGTHTTFEDIPQHPSISSGLGSEILDNMTAKGYSLPNIQVTEAKEIENNLIKHDFTRKITMNDETRTKLIFQQNQLKTCLEEEISKSIDDFDQKKDRKTLDKILLHAINLIKDKKVTTYPELKQKLTIEHKNHAFIVDPVVRSLYCAIEKQGLDNLDKPEFPLAIRDMVRLPAKQTYDTVTHFNKEATPLTTTQMIKETPSPLPEITIEKKSTDQTPKPINAARSCLTCGRSKSKSALPSSSSSTGLLDERRRLQLSTHRNELGNILRDHIQSSQPPIRKFADHPKESEKILRKSLTLITQPKIHSYEQIRHDLKSEHKQTFYLVDPIIDIIRDTFDHCDITQMTEKTNLDILDSNISQTAKLYNNQLTLLTTAEHNALKSGQLSWLQQTLLTNELKEKKLTRKQNKELNKILTRSLDILSTNVITTWDEFNLQLQREYPKANDLCNRSVELLKQAERDGLFLLEQPPVQDKRRPSSLITERARQNLKTNRKKIISSLKTFLTNYNKLSTKENHQLETYLNKTFHYLEEQKQGQFKNYQDLKQQLKQDFQKNNQEKLIEQIVDVIEQAHATNQFDDIDKPEVQILMKDRLDGKPLIIKEMYVSLPSRTGPYGSSKYSIEESSRYLSTSINGDQTLNITTTSHRVSRGLSWREANERARILFYRGKHPAIHYDEQAAAFDVRMLLETASGGTQEIPVTDSDIHELLNSCGVQWDGVNIISLVDHSEDVVRAAEQAALKVIREKGIVDLRTPPATRNVDKHDDDDNDHHNGAVASSATPSS